MKILLTGQPGIGKTTLVLAALSRCGLEAGGFYTRELLEGGRRVGFGITSLGGEESILAHRNHRSRFRVGRYGVDIDALERVGVKSIEEAIEQKDLIVVDEIGTMELFSNRFAGAVLRAVESGKHFLATVMERHHRFADSLKRRDDTRLIEVTYENRDRLGEEIALLLKGQSE